MDTGDLITTAGLSVATGQQSPKLWRYKGYQRLLLLFLCKFRNLVGWTAWWHCASCHGIIALLQICLYYIWLNLANLIKIPSDMHRHYYSCMIYYFGCTVRLRVWAQNIRQTDCFTEMLPATPAVIMEINTRNAYWIVNFFCCVSLNIKNWHERARWACHYTSSQNIHFV